MENEILFEARYRWDFATMCSVYTTLMGKRRYIMIVILLILAAWYVDMTLPLSEVYFSWNMLLAPGLLLFYILWPYYMAWFAVRQHSKIVNGKEADVVVRFSDKEIEGSEVRNVQFYQYEQITRIRTTKKMWLLMIGRKIAIPIPKESFTRGTAEDFPAFIRSKCLGIKGF